MQRVSLRRKSRVVHRSVREVCRYVWGRRRAGTRRFVEQDRSKKRAISMVGGGLGGSVLRVMAGRPSTLGFRAPQGTQRPQS